NAQLRRNECAPQQAHRSTHFSGRRMPIAPQRGRHSPGLPYRNERSWLTPCSEPQDHTGADRRLETRLIAAARVQTKISVAIVERITATILWGLHYWRGRRP